MEIPFEQHARVVMQVATSEAQRGSHESISTGHILLGLIKEHYSAASCALRLVGCDLDEIRREVAAILEPASRPVLGESRAMHLLKQRCISLVANH